MRGAALAIFCFGAVLSGSAQPDAAAAPPAQQRPARSAAGAQWLRLLADYVQGAEELAHAGASGRRAAPGRPAALRTSGAAPGAPVLLLPLRAHGAAAAAAAPRQSTEYNLLFGERKYGHENEDDDYKDVQVFVLDTQPRRWPAARRRPAPASDTERPRPAHSRPEEPRYPAYVRVDRLDETPTSPPVGVAASSEELLEKFRAQTPTAPQLPPAVLSAHDASERAPATTDAGDGTPRDPVLSCSALAPATAPAPAVAPARAYLPLQRAAPSTGAEPPRPRFGRSLLLRGELTVPRADYTEPYTVWWDASSGAARVDFHGGSTSTFRTIQPGGSTQRLEMRVDRSGEGALRRCVRAAAPAAPVARAPPALPDLDLFSFAGYAADAADAADAGRAERWRHTVAGRAGELGAARGEALTFRHELLLRRAPGGGVLPLRYTVAVDSSVLGADCDGYEHRYGAAREQTHPPDLFTPELDHLCDSVEQVNSSSAELAARLEPLREFTLPHRDPLYDDAFERFKTEYNRQYVDGAEEAMRKNLLVQHMRFTRSGNREGATFELAINFLGDRLDAELAELLGVRAEPERERAEPFPHSRAALRASERSLPERFDWRPRGAVSPVRYQGSCASCWAFAVAGAVEGALFVRTRRLTPLSEKCLVDCAHPFGGNGCGGTWPSHAYDYVQSRGLPARDRYPEYSDKVERCAEQSAEPVTRISAHVNVTANSVGALKVAIRRHAPAVVIVDAKAKSFVFYKKGVLYDDRCGKAGARLNHALLAVGWGARRGEPHFVLKNSWSDAWGERGYVRVQARANTCGVLAKPSYPRLEDDDVLGGRAARAPGPQLLGDYDY